MIIIWLLSLSIIFLRFIFLHVGNTLFLFLMNSGHSICITQCFSFQLLMDIETVFIFFLLLQIKLLCTFVHMSLCEHMSSIPLGKL